MPLRQLGEVIRPLRLLRAKAFQGRKRGLEPRDQCTDAIELVILQPRALLGSVQRGGLVAGQFAELVAKAFELLCKPGSAGLRPRAAQQRKLQRFDRRLESARRAAEPTQRM